MEDNIIEIGEGTVYIRAKQVMDIFSIARSTVDSWAKQGILTRHKKGGCVLYEKAEVMKLKKAGISGLV